MPVLTLDRVTRNVTIAQTARLRRLQQSLVSLTHDLLS